MAITELIRIVTGIVSGKPTKPKQTHIPKRDMIQNYPPFPSDPNAREPQFIDPDKPHYRDML